MWMAFAYHGTIAFVHKAFIFSRLTNLRNGLMRVCLRNDLDDKSIPMALLLVDIQVSLYEFNQLTLQTFFNAIVADFGGY